MMIVAMLLRLGEEMDSRMYFWNQSLIQGQARALRGEGRKMKKRRREEEEEEDKKTKGGRNQKIRKQEKEEGTKAWHADERPKKRRGRIDLDSGIPASSALPLHSALRRSKIKLISVQHSTPDVTSECTRIPYAN